MLKGEIKIRGNRQEQNEKAPKNKKKIIIIGVFLTMLALIIGGVFYVSSVLGSYVKLEVDESKLAISEDLTEEQKNIRNIALFGVDSQNGTQGRSDSIMILTLDETHNKVKLTSIMRDSYVDINGKMDKINHAYAFGGPELAIKTLNQNFGLNIKDYISINFKSLTAIIDVLGGIQINVTDEELSHLTGISSIGVHTLNGAQTLQYARIRYAAGGDYQRTQRQRNIMESMYESFRYKGVADYPKLVTAFLPHVTTNMDVTDMLSIGTEYAEVMSAGLEQERFPRDSEGTGATIGGVYYLKYDLDIAGEAMRNFIFEDIRESFKKN